MAKTNYTFEKQQKENAKKKKKKEKLLKKIDQSNAKTQTKKSPVDEST